MADMGRDLCYTDVATVLPVCRNGGYTMNQQTGRTAALYYRVANKQTDSLLFDNQMQKLLCYAEEQGLDGFTLYADIGKSGATLDRPAFSKLKADIEAGRICKLIVYDISRIARSYLLYGEFIGWAQVRGVEIISVIDGVLTAAPFSEMALLYRSFVRGGGGV